MGGKERDLFCSSVCMIIKNEEENLGRDSRITSLGGGEGSNPFLSFFLFSYYVLYIKKEKMEGENLFSLSIFLNFVL